MTARQAAALARCLHRQVRRNRASALRHDPRRARPALNDRRDVRQELRELRAA